MQAANSPSSRRKAVARALWPWDPEADSPPDGRLRSQLSFQRTSLVGDASRMNALLGIRMMVTLLVAVLLPLDPAHCALMPLPASAVAIVSEHRNGHDQDCCPESPPSPEPPSPADPCCCPHIQVPTAPVPLPISLAAPASVPTLLAAMPAPTLVVRTGGVFLGSAPDARSGAPPEPSAAPQSPRSPPYSA